MKERTILFAALIMAVGIALSGIAISSGIHHYAVKDRSVAVKGLSTREVMSDHVIWPMSFSLSGNNLPSLYSDLSRQQEVIVAFLVEQGFTKEDIQLGKVSVNDNWESYYNQRPEFNYTMTASIVISTDNVELVRRSQNCPSQLLSKGIILNSNDWSIDYQFNGLAELKPSMIEEATKNARAVAQKFADDANCRLGSIRHASQGQFSIDSDNNCPWIKHIRVVTTVDYYLN